MFSPPHAELVSAYNAVGQYPFSPVLSLKLRQTLTRTCPAGRQFHGDGEESYFFNFAWNHAANKEDTESQSCMEVLA